MGRPPPPRPRRRGRQAALLAALLLVVWLLTRYDLALVLWLAYRPVSPWAMLLDTMLWAEPATGMPYLLLPFLALPTLLHLATPQHAQGAPHGPSTLRQDRPANPATAAPREAAGGLRERLLRWRGATGYLMAATWSGSVSIYVATHLLTRPSPSLVLSGHAVFTPWYAPQFGAGGEQFAAGAAGNAGALALLLAYALLLRRAGRTGPAAAVGALAVLLSVLAALAGISLQTAWPFDAGLSGLLGMALPVWLYGLRVAETPQVAADELDQESTDLPAADMEIHRRDPWALHPASQGHWPIRFSVAFLGLGISILLTVGGLHGAPGSSGLHIGVGLLGLLFFVWRLRRLLRPLGWGVDEE